MKQLIALAEKTVWTYLQVLLVGLLAGPTINADTATIVALAALPAAFTVVISGVASLNFVGLPLWLDILWRVIRTYVASFLGILVALPVFHLDSGVLTAANMAGVTAVLVVVKGYVAGHIGVDHTAAALPGHLDPDAVPPAEHFAH